MRMFNMLHSARSLSRLSATWRRRWIFICYDLHGLLLRVYLVIASARGMEEN